MNSTVLLNLYGKGRSIGHATGFFFSDFDSDGAPASRVPGDWSRRLWLITNRHVLSPTSPNTTTPDCIGVNLRDIEGPKRRVKGEWIEGQSVGARYRQGNRDLELVYTSPESDEVLLDQSFLQNNAWLPEPENLRKRKSGPEPDVAAILIADRNRSGNALVAPLPSMKAGLSKIEKWVGWSGLATNGGELLKTASADHRLLTFEHLYDQEDPPEIGRRLLLIGYPVGGVDLETGTPVAKSGTVASDYLASFQQSGFLVDTNQLPGSSGSPVITAPEFVSVTKGGLMMTPPSVVGVHSSGQHASEDGAGLQSGQSLELGFSWPLPSAIFECTDPDHAPRRLVDYVTHLEVLDVKLPHPLD